MSFYDDASLVLLAGGAAGKDGKVFSLKPHPNTVSGELVTNGGFDADSDWIKVGESTISGGKGHIISTTGVWSNLNQTNVFTVGKHYRLSIDATVNINAADYAIKIQDGSGDVGYITTSGSYVFYFTSGGTTLTIGRYNTNSAVDVDIDNVSVVEVDKLPADFYFERGTDLTATRIGKDGYIEKGRENLLKHSGSFDVGTGSGGWAKVNTSVTGGQIGYDSSADAYKLEATSTGASSNSIYQDVTVDGLKTISIFAKAGNNVSGTQSLRLSLNEYLTSDPNTKFNSRAFFDLSDGSVISTTGNVISAHSESFGGGWFRLSMSVEVPSTNTADRVVVFMGSGGATINDQTIGDYFFIQNFQLEIGLAASDYIKTGDTTATAGVLENEPRFNYTGGGCPALLMELQSTNKLIHSEYFNDYWAAQDASVTYNATTSPEGLINAAKLIPDNGTGGNRSIGKNFTGLSGVHTFSVFAKAAGHDYIALRMRNPGNGFVMFNLNDGSVENEVSGSNQYVANSAKIESFGNDWYRCSASFDPSQSTTVGQLFVSLSTGIDGTEISDFDGDGTNGVFIYGAQLEANEFTTSYIPTYGASATRNQDVTGELEHGITMGTTCSVFFEGKHLAPDITQLSFFQLRTDDNNRLLFFGSGTTSSAYNFLVQHRVGGTSTNSTSKTLNIGDSFKVLARMDDTTMDVFINGELYDTKTITAQDHFGKMNLYRTGAAEQSGHEVSQAMLFTTALSNNDAEIITGAPSYNSFATMAASTALNYTIYE